MTVPNHDSLQNDLNDREDERPPSLGENQNLIIVSNRQPYSHRYETGENGKQEITVDQPAGGLTAGLDPVVRRVNGTWIAWGDGEADREVTDDAGTIQVPPEEKDYTLRRIWLSEREVQDYYYGYSNRVLWPLCHGGIWQTEFAERYWQSYRQVNETFAEAIKGRTTPSSLVWFQDYHFALAPRQVYKSASESAFLMHFWHIVWPSWNTFRVCPQAKMLLKGLLGNDLLGFHIDRYCGNFLDCVDKCLEDAFVDHENNRIRYDGHTTHIKSFPMGVDATTIGQTADSVRPSFWTEFTREHDINEETQVAIGVDRLDYTKGIVERLNALERLWEMNPEWQGKLTYVQKADESRSLIPEYQDLQQNVMETIERINSRFGTRDWQPVVYIDDWLTDEELHGLYRYSDVILVSAVCDGMNLVAKEYVAAQVDCGDREQDLDPNENCDEQATRNMMGNATCGILVLSDQAGAYEELGEHALTVNPYDTEMFAETIKQAVTLDDTECQERMTALREQVASNDIHAWMNDIFEEARRLGNTGNK